MAAAGSFGTAAVVRAAAAGEYLEALDRVLPGTVEEFMEYIRIHSEADGFGFITRQLLLLTSRCLVGTPNGSAAHSYGRVLQSLRNLGNLQDFADGQGRGLATALLQFLVCKPSTCESKEKEQQRWEALEEFAAQVLPEPNDLAELLLDAVDQMCSGWELLGEIEDGSQRAQKWCCALAAVGMLLRQWPQRKADAQVVPATTVERLEDIVQKLVLAAVNHKEDVVR